VKIAVAGGTGQVGRQVVEVLRRSGHEAAVLATSEGVDLVTGTGLAEPLDGVEAVIDVTNMRTLDADEARRFFAAETTNLLAAEAEAGVSHHVVLSVVGLDRVKRVAHYVGKLEQERLALSGPVPATIVRATQFFEFPTMLAGWNRRGGAATLPPLVLQPVAIADVAEYLVEVALGEPRNGVVEIGGPESLDLVDMARRTLAVRGETLRLIPTWDGPYGAGMTREELIPGPGARIGRTTFDAWLEQQIFAVSQRRRTGIEPAHRG
jgi:uncharacterized protein YbjT (DUF2867 family)